MKSPALDARAIEQIQFKDLAFGYAGGKPLKVTRTACHFAFHVTTKGHFSVLSFSLTADRQITWHLEADVWHSNLATGEMEDSPAHDLDRHLVKLLQQHELEVLKIYLQQAARLAIVEHQRTEDIAEILVGFSEAIDSNDKTKASSIVEELTRYAGEDDPDTLRTRSVYDLVFE